MFKTRLLSGIVLVAVALLTIISGGYVLFFTLLGISLIGMQELYKVMKVREDHFNALEIAGYFGAVIYYVLMILALVSSGAPSLFVAADRIKAIIPPARNAKNQTVAMIGCCLIYSVVVVIMATGGLTTIVSYYFQYLGYFGQICGVIPMAIVWPILRAKGVKPIIPAPLKSSSGQQK